MIGIATSMGLVVGTPTKTVGTPTKRRQWLVEIISKISKVTNQRIFVYTDRHFFIAFIDSVKLETEFF